MTNRSETSYPGTFIHKQSRNLTPWIHILKRIKELTSWNIHPQPNQKSLILGNKHPNWSETSSSGTHTQRAQISHTWYIFPWTETSYTATYSHKHVRDPTHLGYTLMNSLGTLHPEIYIHKQFRELTPWDTDSGTQLSKAVTLNLDTDSWTPQRLPILGLGGPNCSDT